MSIALNPFPVIRVDVPGFGSVDAEMVSGGTVMARSVPGTWGYRGRPVEFSVELASVGDLRRGYETMGWLPTNREARGVGWDMGERLQTVWLHHMLHDEIVPAVTEALRRSGSAFTEAARIRADLRDYDCSR